MIVHTAVRTKVPLKKKVRGERKPKNGAISKLKSGTTNKANTSAAAGLAQTSAATTNAATGADATATAIALAIKRQGASLANAKKLVKRTKRTSNQHDETADSNIATVSAATSKPKKSTTRSKSAKHKGIIDYSKRMNDKHSHSHTNTFSRVHKWLLESPVGTASQPTTSSGTSPTTANEAEHGAAKVRQAMMSKSQSMPERLALRPPKNVKSVDNMNDNKVKLQVVYKPPFKFRLKLSKNSAVKTKVVGAGGAGMRSKRKTPIDKNNVGRSTRDGGPKGRRTALLIRTTTDEVDGATGVDCTDDQQKLMLSEPNYETLNPKTDRSSNSNTYENVTTATTSSGLHGAGKSDSINTATFRINKSASASNMLGSGNKYHSISNSNSNGSHSNASTAAKTSHSGKGSSQNLDQIGTFGSYSTNSRGSTMNLSKQFGSSQNLIRASNSNLAKSSSRNSFDIKRGFYDMSRSSTTNLHKDRRHGSHLNLLKHQHLRGSNSNMNSLDDVSMPMASNGRSRRNSTTNSNGKSNDGMSRSASKSNMKITPQRRSSVSNIPRASLNGTSSSKASNGNGGQPSFQRQTSQPTTMSSSASTVRMPRTPSERPHTADAKNNKPFEWPATNFGHIDDAVNLVNDNNK